MKKFVILFFLSVFAIGAKANYSLNNSEVDKLFSNATEIQLTNLMGYSNALDLAGTNAAFFSGEKNAIVAAILSFFLGGLAIHRYYLGTKPTMFFYYFCTIGGIFGIVPFVDFIMLLVNSDNVGQYCNNNKFIMWL
jgi:TM2 domain-containing membrane protein YozV